jgi:hypothetical protein
VGGREGQRRDQAERLARLAATDGDVRAGMPPVDLADLARLIRRALISPRGQEDRPDACQVVLQDGDPAAVAERPQALADDRRADGCVLVEHGRDGIGVLVELRARPPPFVVRWLGQAQQPIDRVAAHAQSPRDGCL